MARILATCIELRTGSSLRELGQRRWRHHQREVGAITLGVVYFLIRAGEWVVLANPAGNASGVHGHAMEIINQSIFYSLLLTGLIVVLLPLRDLWRLVHIPHRQVRNARERSDARVARVARVAIGAARRQPKQ